MKKRFLKLFLVYSYVSLVCWGGSINFLNAAKRKEYERKTGNKIGSGAEWIWNDTLRNFKEGWKILNN